MKIRNYITIFLAVVSILLLIALTAFMTVYVGDESNPLRQTILRFWPSAQQAVSDTPAPETTAEQTDVASAKEHSFVFVGDSRTIGMGDAVNDHCVYIGAEGQGYTWFSTDGMAALETELQKNPNRKVILNFGVNDPENINLYIDLYTSMIQDHPNTSFYFLSVNPLVDSEDLNTTNEMISLFNATMGSNFPQNYLDSNSYLATVGYETVDGLHYTDETYRTIHDFVVDMLQ